MTRQQLYWIEKLEIQITSVLALAVVYLLGRGLIHGLDRSGPVSLLANGSYGALAVFAGIFWIVSALCAALTVTARPAGAMTTVLVGVGGIALGSGQMRSLLWNYSYDPSRLFHKLMVELLVLAVMLVVADIIVGLVRQAIQRAKPAWAWQGFLAVAEPRRGVRQAIGLVGEPAGSWLDETCIVGPLAGRPLRQAAGKSADQPGRTGQFAVTGQAMIIAAVVAAGLILCLMRSADRGQIIFALFASFFVAALAGQYVCPSRYGRLVVLLPIVIGLGAYALAGAASISGLSGWMETGFYARALPVDWLTAGGSGAALGYWLSTRLREAKLFDSMAK